MTISEAARKLGRSIDAIYKLVWSGKLKATKVNTNSGDDVWDVDENAVERRLANQRSAKSRQRRHEPAA